MNNTVTMGDYILEEQEVLLRLLDNRKELTAGLCEALRQRPVQEIVLCGSGTSYHAGLAARKLIEQWTGIRTRAELPMIFVSQQQLYTPDTLFLGISQGGNSLSTAEAMKKARDGGCLCAGLSENEDALIFTLSELRLKMDCGPELSIAKTKGYTATVVILWLAGLEIALALQKITLPDYEESLARLEATIRNFEILIPLATAWVDTIASELTSASRILVLGYGNNYANVLEGSLKMLETLRFGITGYEIEEFCHGIYNSIKPDTRLIYMASPGQEKQRVLPIHSVIKETTEYQYILYQTLDGYASNGKDGQLPFLDDPDFHILEYILPLQLIASRLPYQLGIDPFTASDPQFHQKVGSKTPTLSH